MKRNILLFVKMLIVVFIISSTISNSVFAQGNTYKLDGNNNGTSSSKLGFTNSADLKLVTNDTVRETITKSGDVIFGKNLTINGTLTTSMITPAGNIFNIAGRTIFNKSVLVQDSMRITGRLAVGTGTLIVDPGTSASGFLNSVFTTNGDLFIQSQPSNYNTILNANGNIGRTLIGLNAPTPANAKLEVNGNINISNSQSGYFINGSGNLNEVLKYHGNTAFPASITNIFVGVGAGDNNTVTPPVNGADNTAVGCTALHMNTIGTSNTAIGNSALYGNIDGIANTASGFDALVSNISGIYNLADGYGALLNSRGNFNTACGAATLQTNIMGGSNTALGYAADVTSSSLTNVYVVKPICTIWA